MRALRYRGDDVVELADLPMPIPAGHEALVRIEASGLCGSERRALRTGDRTNGGHEAVGVVVEPGPSGFRADDRVGLAIIIGCGSCRACREGRDVQCRQAGKSSTTGWHAEFAAVDARALHRMPDGIDPAEGVLLAGDSIGVPVRAMRRAPHRVGDRIVVLGLGPVGLGHVLVRSHLGADVVAVEPSAYRRALAAGLGARVHDVGDEVGGDADLVIECSGRADSIARAFALVRNGGTVVQSAEHHDDIAFNPSGILIRREITYLGSWYFAREDFAEMTALAAGGLPLRRMLTHPVAPGTAPAAVAAFLTGETGKVVIRWD